jgi:hypothetical protein
MFYVVTPRASFSRTRISGSLVCAICVLDRIPFLGEYDLPSILFYDVVRLQIAIGRSSSRRPRDPAAVEAPCDPRQLSQLHPNSIPPERVFSNSQPEEGGELRAEERGWWLMLWQLEPH